MGVVQVFHLAFREALKRLGHRSVRFFLWREEMDESPSKLLQHVATR